MKSKKENMKKLYDMINEAGTHSMGIVPRVFPVVTLANLLVKVGSAAGQVEATSADTDVPYGISVTNGDEAYDKLSVALLTSPGTKLGVLAAGGADDGNFLMPAAGGKLQKITATPGTYYVCARALMSGAAGDTIEIETFAPRPITVT